MSSKSNKPDPKKVVRPSKNVVVCVNVTSHKTKSGLHLPNTENKPEMGEVVAFGEGKKPIDFKIGDVIIFRKYTDNRVFMHGHEFNFVRFSDREEFNDVMGIIDK